MSKFLSQVTSLADKAQSAINTQLQSHGLSQGIESITGTATGAAGAGAGAEHGQTQGGVAATGLGVGGKSHTLGSLQHQFRMLQQQYSSATPVQKIITSQKGVALDYDGVSRDSKNESRELYMWGQNEDADLKDVTDRLAYINYVHGSLSATLAKSLDEARGPLKGLRDAEAELIPRRNARNNLQTQIARIEHDQQKGMEKRMAELNQQLHRAEMEDEDKEKELEIMKRTALRKSEEMRWLALREYGDKLVLLAEASSPIISALPSIPPSASSPYTGAQTTATARASLQHTLDNYKPGTISHSFTPSAADLNRSDSRSFGITHAQELSTIAAASNSHSIPPTLPLTPPATKSNAPSLPFIPIPHPSSPVHVPIASGIKPPRSPPSAATSPIYMSSPPLNPLALNNAPAPVPKPNNSNSATSSMVSGASPTASNILHMDPDQAPVGTALPVQEGPTVAETGVPVQAGEGGPGPASGSLRDLRSGSMKAPQPQSAYGAPMSSPPPFQGGGGQVPGYGHAPGYGMGVGESSSGKGAAPKWESAEEEKRRLAMEMRERELAEEVGDAPPADLPNPYPGAEEELHKKDGTEPPPYQDF